MAMQFQPSRTAPAAVAAAPAPQSYDIQDDRREVVARLAGSDEIEALTSKLDVNDMTSIVTFGSGAAEQISRASDAILRSMDMSQVNDSGELMQALAKIMEQFNMDEIRENNSLFGRLFGNARKQLDRIVTKYHTMGDEVDKIYIGLRQYENEIKQSNQKLENMFRANVGYFHELEKYIVAGEQGLAEIAAYRDQLKAEQARTGDPAINFELQTLDNAHRMLEQRTHDLRLAEAVAMQSIPMIKAIQFNNMNLVQKINSAFIVTLPVFKQALAQAILLKRQRLQSDALSALNARTNEMLARNARNVPEQLKTAARGGGESAGQGETLENAWHTIVDGIAETRRLQDSARAQRRQDQERLESIKRDFAVRQSGGK